MQKWIFEYPWVNHFDPFHLVHCTTIALSECQKMIRQMCCIVKKRRQEDGGRGFITQQRLLCIDLTNDHCNTAEAIHVSFVAVCSRNLMYYVVDGRTIPMTDVRLRLNASPGAGAGVLGSSSESDVAGPSQL